MRWVLLLSPFQRWRNWGTEVYMTYPVTQPVSHRYRIWIWEDRILPCCLTASQAPWTNPSWIGLKVSDLCLLLFCPALCLAHRRYPKVFIITIILHVTHLVQPAWVCFLRYKSSIVISQLEASLGPRQPRTTFQVQSPLGAGPGWPL